jgi:NAD-dependent SIR2 family protein deacetylase
MADDGGRPREAPPRPSPAPAPVRADAANDSDDEKAAELGRLFERGLQVKDENDDKGADDKEENSSTAETDSSGSTSPEDDDAADEATQQALLRALAGLSPSTPPPLPPHQRLLPSLDLAGVAAYLSSDACKSVVFMVGAGASTSAGIPDFRTPGTGLYDNLADLGLPHPEAVFDIDFFRENPRPFFTLAKSLYPRRRRKNKNGGGKSGASASSSSSSSSSGPRPTPAHHFFELVRRKGKLRRVFTQNIDALEHEAGLGEEHVVAAHGNFFGCHCVECGRDHERSVVERAIFFDEEDDEDDDDEDEAEGEAKTAAPPPPSARKEFTLPRCRDARCGGLVKPSIVFFGEGLPRKFFEKRRDDLPQADLLIVVGTSLVVHPFAGLMHDVAPNVPRLLINRDRVGEARRGGSRGFVFSEGQPGFGRDVLYQGNADDGVRELARLCGWGEELEALVAAAEASLEEEEEQEAATTGRGGAKVTQQN